MRRRPMPERGPQLLSALYKHMTLDAAVLRCWECDTEAHAPRASASALTAACESFIAAHKACRFQPVEASTS